MRPINHLPTAGSPGANRYPSRLLVVLLLAVLALFGTPQPGCSQRSADENRLQRFVNDVGQLLFFFAWPTATYQSVSYDGATRRANGWDASLTLYGESAFGGNLWTKLILEVRDGQISDLHWGPNNAILAPPGSTMRTIGQALAQLNEQYQQGNGEVRPPPPPPPAPTPPVELRAICVTNATQYALGYTVRWSGTSESRTLQPGEQRLYWSNAATPVFSLAFDDDFSEGYTERTFQLAGAARFSAPVACTDAVVYDFKTNEQFIGLEPRVWIPGMEHAYNTHVVRSDTVGRWHCDPGYRWAVPDDQNSLWCVRNDTGVVGFSLASGYYPSIRGVTRGTPADRAGLTAGLIVLSVDGFSTANRTLEDVRASIRGPIGSTLRLEVTTSLSTPSRTVVLIRQ